MSVPVLDIILLAIRWAHALAAVVWIGGSLFLLLAARPALRSLGANGGLAGRALAAEFRPIVATAIGVLLVSGVILAAQRLTSDAAGLAYTAFLAAKILLSVYAFIIAWRLPRRRDAIDDIGGPNDGVGHDDDGGRTGNRRGRIRRTLLGPGALAVLGVIVIGLADVLAWLFEQGLAG